MTTKTLVAPLVHLNGTSRDSLLEQLEAAAEAVNTAQNVLQNCHPNGRDYYPLAPIDGKPVISIATEQHWHRQRLLESVRLELNAIYDAIVDGQLTKTVYRLYYQENTND